MQKPKEFTGRQRAEGIRPSGNKRKANTKKPKAGCQIPDASHATQLPPGREPGCSTSA